MSEVSILLVGNTDRPEFRRARAALAASGRVVSTPDAESAAAALTRRQAAVDVIVIAQSYPAEFSHRAIDRLRRLAPLARVLGLMGSWCEGEVRTGKPWPAVIRIYWHQWPPRCDLELLRMRQGQISAWGLPITATEEERLLLQAEQPVAAHSAGHLDVAPMGGQGLVAIHTRLYEMEQWLSAALRCRGQSTVWLRPPRAARVEGATAAIFDGSDCRGEELRQLRRLAATLGRLPHGAPVPIIALLDFPRIEDHDRALAAGAAAVLSKPLHLDDLFWQLDRALEL